MNYRDTLNLPKTQFPMKASLAVNEPRILEKWYADDLYDRICESRKDAEIYVLHDGPPYANGHIHIGTALNKVLKDIVMKYKTMEGFRVPFKPGWDCHGLPIEHNVMKELGNSAKSMSQIEIRAECAAYAERYVSIMREEFKRLGGLGEWERPYLTMSHQYEATVVSEFQNMLLSGRIYPGQKPVHWCISCRTALAEAEVEYADHVSPSVWVKFQVISDLGSRIPELAGKTNVFVIIWTTTPWTLPANLAIAFNPTLDYVAFEDRGEIYIVADALFRETVEVCQFDFPRIIARFPGSVLEGFNCRHPFYDRVSKLVLADYVTFETGTGCVHTAPGHGQEDFETGLKYGLDIYNPVDDTGCFDKGLPLFGGMNVFEANAEVNKVMRDDRTLLAEREIVHSYPHCWRCKQPVVFRATRQWFISIDHDNLRNAALKAIDTVDWYPRWGKERIYGMVENRPDWCISRQRVWGVPLTIFTCEKCHAVLRNETVSSQVIEAVRRYGIDIWFTGSNTQFIPAGTLCEKCGHREFKREQDIIDVWFESGVSHRAVLTSDNGLTWPSNLYLEGSDQHRGWFQSSLIISVANHGRAPFETVLTHGFVVDGDGKKMSKSEGNVIVPEDIIQKYGADILRLWVAAEDYTEDIRISTEILDRLVETYRRIRNTCRFMLGNLFDFNPETDILPVERLEEMDRFILHRWAETVKITRKSFHELAFYQVVRQLHQFCVVELSSLFLDVSKDRLYCSRPEDTKRRSAQTVIYLILIDLVRYMAPILAFTMEEAWEHVPGSRDSIHMQKFFILKPEWTDPELNRKWEILLAVREKAALDLERKRKEKLIGHSLDAKVTVRVPVLMFPVLKSAGENLLAEILIVSQVVLEDNHIDSDRIEDVSVEVDRADGSKCERCWQIQTNVGQAEDHPNLCSRCVEVVRAL
ncbi:isoleucine--tRNA ligase [bacterium]|nr:isoleucine--tRNA ligase [candidate division CSSED10-310 bacterium]